MKLKLDIEFALYLQLYNLTKLKKFSNDIKIDIHYHSLNTYINPKVSLYLFVNNYIVIFTTTRDTHTYFTILHDADVVKINDV